MKKLLLSTLMTGLISMTCIASDSPVETNISTTQSQIISLFDGKTFNGFELLGGKHKYEIKDAVMIGTAVAKQPNAFMTTKAKFKDFELTFEVMLEQPESLNSGCQIRSLKDPKASNGHLMGPQVEIAVNGKAGFIYGERMKKKDGQGRGWLSPDVADSMKDPKKSSFKRKQWNKYRILVVGNHYQTWVNDILITDFVNDEMSIAGHIGFQVHSSKGSRIGKTVSWKNINIRPITP